MRHGGFLTAKTIQNHRGFTLIEIITIFVIISIIAVIITLEDPEVDISLRGEAEKIVSAIRYTQMLSMTRGARYRINFFSTSYTITDLAGTTTINHPATNQASTTLPTHITLSVNAAITSSFLAFDGQGIPYVTSSTPGTTLAATGTITLTSDTETQIININHQTGRVSIS